MAKSIGNLTAISTRVLDYIALECMGARNEKIGELLEMRDRVVQITTINACEDMATAYHLAGNLLRHQIPSFRYAKTGRVKEWAEAYRGNVETSWRQSRSDFIANRYTN